AMNLRSLDVSGAAREVAAETAGGFNKVLPWLIGLLVLVPLLLWMSRSCSTKTAQEAADTTRAAADATRNAAQNPANSPRPAAAALRSVQLPGGGTIQIPTGGFTDSLVAFLNGNAPAGQSFAFDAVTFETDSATLASASNDQLGQLAA